MDFYIMSRDEAVAAWQDNNLEILNNNLLPIYFRKYNDVEKWLVSRAADSRRANVRLLKKALRLTAKDDVSTVVSVNAVTITDSYWIKPLDSDLTYDDVRFDNDYFASLALTGSYDSFNRVANSKQSKTPELTNIGSFEKCWKVTDGKWWMHKKANYEEMFSELFICLLGKELGFNMAEYERGKGVIKTKDFTDNASVNFEPMFSFMGDNEDYIETLNALKDLCPDAIGDYVKMLFLDTICANPDRHTFNFGVLRDVTSGKIMGLAPNFDNNMALISRGYPKNKNRKDDILVKLFNELIEYDERLKEYIPEVNEALIKRGIKKVGMRVKTNLVLNFIMNGYKQIER
ncbi:MAG: hypothetical protein ACI3XA_07180 [Clostridia bacterium]